MSASRRDRGFTLLEMVIVVGILAALAATAMLSVSQLDDQNRFDDTRARALHLREAIVGPSGTVNGSPILQGFVADMGRLPSSLAELTARSLAASFTFQSFSTTSASFRLKNTSDADCTDGSGGFWSAGFGGGWRGPYVQPDQDGTYRDGWGNLSATSDTLNFGWTVMLPATLLPPYSTDNFVMTSYGSDNLVDGTPPVPGAPWDTKTDSSFVIGADDYLVSFPPAWSVTVRFGGSGTFTAPLELRLYFPFTEASSGSATSATKLAFRASGTVHHSTVNDAIANNQPVTFTFTSSQPVPIGVRSLVVWDTAVDRPARTSLQQPIPVALVPRASLPQNIYWRTSP